MSLSSLSIRRHVLAIVMSTVIVLFGVISFTYLGVREYPAVDPPVITVSTNYRGANADVIESQITEVLEESVNGVEGIRTLTSVSREGRSTVTVEFDLDVDLERAANDVRDRVSRTLGQLPPDIDPPIVAKADADAFPLAFLGVRSAERNLLELTRYAEENFAERLQTISGVASVDVWGAQTYAMRVWIDPQRLAESGEVEGTRTAMVDWMMDLVATVEPDFITTDRRRAVDTLAPELDTLREVLHWSREQDPAGHARLVGRLWWFWYSTRHWVEARQWIAGATPRRFRSRIPLPPSAEIRPSSASSGAESG